MDRYDAHICARAQTHTHTHTRTHSRRHGQGVLRFRDGSRIEGEFSAGTLHGHARFLYPDGCSGFEGLWEEGDMKAARYFGQEPPLPPWPAGVGGQGRGGAGAGGVWGQVVFAADESTETCIGRQPLLRDAYETLRCRVGRSRLCATSQEGVAGGNTAGEGLFVVRPVAAGELVCYYNGVRVPHRKVDHDFTYSHPHMDTSFDARMHAWIHEMHACMHACMNSYLHTCMHPYKVDKRAWRDNDNCISLDAEYAIDVPKTSASLSAYCATLVLSLSLSLSLTLCFARARGALVLALFLSLHTLRTHTQTHTPGPQGQPRVCQQRRVCAGISPEIRPHQRHSCR